MRTRVKVVPVEAPMMRALVVDDNELVRRTLKMLLASLQVDVTEAEDGHAATQAIDANPQSFDVIFCDLQMPGRDGMQTLRDLAERHVASALILMSGQEADILGSAIATARLHRLNVLGQLQKPFRRDKIAWLLQKVREPQGEREDGQARCFTEQDLRLALERSELTVVFQPKITAGVVGGAEVLARWLHPDHGTLLPIEFIPLAEETGLIDDLTMIVLRRATDAYRHLQGIGFEFPFAINLSTRSMTNLYFADRLRDVVAAAGMPPRNVIFEVTENRLAENLAAFLETATRLRLMGFRLSIDDFGTGFSTLEQVGRLPVSELKIDRAFVAGASDKPRIRHILEASLRLGHSLGLSCVCEGVESEDDLRLAQSLGADAVQGFFVARPMDLDAFGAWLSHPKDSADRTGGLRSS